ncbi:hypothetical protein [Streptomyces sp. NPDC087270]|uniref:hypothetical protein n=1 Tax=Streptomyces sp. NPDC087270 TaxID=3365774 RepID=UPI0037FE17B8
MGAGRVGDGPPEQGEQVEQAERPDLGKHPGKGSHAERSAEAEQGAEADRSPGKGRRLDLSVPQVAGSAVAAVVAAKLASNLGVYGTIMGAGVVSVLGTCGGSLLQHVFHRTGRHVHEVAGHVHGAATQVKPKLLRSATETAAAATRPAADTGTAAARTFTAVEPPAPAAPAAPTAIGPVMDTTVEPEAEPAADATSPFPLDATGTFAGPTAYTAYTSYTTPTAQIDPESTGYSEGTVHRARGLRWKRPAAAVALAFGLTMGGITVCELASGQNISGHGSGTTIGNAFTGGNSSHSRKTPSPGTTESPSGDPSTGTRDGGDPTPSGTRPSTGGTAPTSPTPSRTPSTGTGTGGGANTGGGTGTSGGTGTGGAGTGGSVRPSPSAPSVSPSPSASGNPGGGGADAQDLP